GQRGNRQPNQQARGGNPNGRGSTGAVNQQERGPITGENFRDFTDRLRDVEEMVGDPRLRAEAARIREQARELRAEFTRHSKEPSKDLLLDTLGRPLVELRDAVAQELMRKQSAEAM